MDQKEDKSSLRKLDLATGILLLLTSIFFLIQSWQLLRNTLSKGTEWYLSAGLVPMIICALLLICSLILICNALRYKLSFSIRKEELKAHLKSRPFWATIFIISWFAVYIFLLLNWFSYTIATIVFLVVFMIVFADKDIKKIAIGSVISVITTLLIAYCFGSLVGIPLP